MGNIRDAFRSLLLYKSRLSEAKPHLGSRDVSAGGLEFRVFPSLPLLNFLGLLLFAVQRGRADGFRALRRQYLSVLREVDAWDEVRPTIPKENQAWNLEIHCSIRAGQNYLMAD